MKFRLTVLPTLVIFVAVSMAAATAFADEALQQTSPGDSFQRGVELMDAGNYEPAVELLEQAVEAAPDNADYFHALGKAYGLLAAHSPWYRAVNLATKTREAFEHALSLDPEHRDTIRDLAEYYESAPGFLGGDTRKAEELRRRLRNLSDAA